MNEKCRVQEEKMEGIRTRIKELKDEQGSWPTWMMGTEYQASKESLLKEAEKAVEEGKLLDQQRTELFAEQSKILTQTVLNR